MSKIAVIGAGATGISMSAILSSKGHNVTLADTEAYKDILDDVEKAGVIEISGTTSVKGMPERITTDIESAVKDAELILCCTISNRDEEVATLIAPYLTPDKAVLIGAGNGGSIIYHRVFEAFGKGDCLVGETAGNFFPARYLGNGKTMTGLPLSSKGVSAFPHARTEEISERFSEVWDLTPTRSLFESLFNGPNIICHSAGIVSNLAAIDSGKGDFNLFTMGLSPAVLDLTDALWKEKAALYEAMGCTPADPPRGMLTGTMNDDPQYKYFRMMDGPDSLKNRYITEDMPCLVCFFISIARHQGVPVPLFESIINIISAATGEDFYAEGRTLENLGLWDLSKEGLIEFFES